MARRTLARSGFGTTVTDPFAPRRFRAARLHPRRDDEGHGDGTAVDTPDDGDGGESEGDQPEEKPDEKPEIDWKKESRKHEAEAKKGRAAIAELDRIKAKSRTAEENAQKERDDARAEAEAAKAEAARERAARKYGLSDEDLELLDGTPSDKFDAKAKALSERIKAAAPAGRSGNPVGGGRGATNPLDDPKKFAADLSSRKTGITIY